MKIKMALRQVRTKLGVVLSMGVLVALETFAGTSAFALVAQPAADSSEHPIPAIVERDGRFALMVDGRPFLMLGVQANNSSAWPAYLGKVWPAAAALHANTVELPIYWEQLEPTEGHFDFSLVDLILKQAREHHVHLVLLWFGTWKNGSSHYTPEWIKEDQTKYPFLQNEQGETVDSPSPFSSAFLEADKAAFRSLMRHLKQADPERTVLMVQVENESGVWGAIRDYGAEAQRTFAGSVPEKLARGMNKSDGSWSAVFGDDADETFEAWYTARFIEQVAEAGKEEYPLPMYVNAALRDPLHPGRPGTYESGAPTDNNLKLWKIAAPSISVVAPDIYLPDYEQYMKVIELYKRDHNPLFIPETGSAPPYARYLFAAIGQGAIGWSPFGLDYARFPEDGDENSTSEGKALKPFAEQYALLAPIEGLLAKGILEGKVQGTCEDPEHHQQTLAFDRWQAEVSYGMPAFGNWMQPKGNTPPDGGVVILQMGPDEFLVAGHHVRVDFRPNVGTGKKRLWLKVEEGHYDEKGKWSTARIWNGDQTDWGLNLPKDGEVLLRVRLTTF